MYNSAAAIYTNSANDTAGSILTGKKNKLSDFLLQAMIDFPAVITIILL